ncbi:hypothetical protein MMC17_007352 [Xylographa soralifera]|nr:hypothetical protein [Xylographa soralifera]
MSLSTPSFGALRLASSKDIERIGIVATCGFFGGPVCAWYRPFMTQYPMDTLESYCQIFAEFIKSPRHAVLVAVDSYDGLEGTVSKLNLPIYEQSVIPVTRDKVIVGVAVWALEEGSRRTGDFQGDTDIYPELSRSENRDQHQEHNEILGERAHAAQKKYPRHSSERNANTAGTDAAHRYFEGISELEMLVVHPAYRGHGHGGALVQWGLELARLDGVKQGVIGPAKGMKLYESLGFELLDELQWQGDDITPDGLKLGVLRFDPSPMNCEPEH